MSCSESKAYFICPHMGNSFVFWMDPKEGRCSVTLFIYINESLLEKLPSYFCSLVTSKYSHYVVRSQDLLTEPGKTFKICSLQMEWLKKKKLKHYSPAIEHHVCFFSFNVELMSIFYVNHALLWIFCVFVCDGKVETSSYWVITIILEDGKSPLIASECRAKCVLDALWLGKQASPGKTIFQACLVFGRLFFKRRCQKQEAGEMHRN